MPQHRSLSLADQRRCKACPRVILLLGKLVDFPSDMLGNRERDVGVVAPLSVFRQAIEQEVGDLARVDNDRRPSRMPAVRPLSGLSHT